MRGKLEAGYKPASWKTGPQAGSWKFSGRTRKLEIIQKLENF